MPMKALTYDVVEQSLAAALTDQQIVANGKAINSVYIAQLPAAVTLLIRFGSKGYFPLVQGQSLEFHECMEERDGLFITTTGVSGTSLLLVWTPPGGSAVS